MFCSSCGSESTIGLNYCKKCGSSLTSSPEDPPVRGVPFALVGLFAIVIAVLGLVGVAAIIEGGADLAHAGVGNLLVPVAVCAATVILGVSGLLVWLLMKLLNSYGVSQPVRKSKKSLPPAELPRLGQPVTGISSVTENTTRHFDSVIQGSRDTSDMQ
ncbi:MAG TPA: hypothetical protein VI756_15765 [Blastocatellia bacterium]